MMPTEEHESIIARTQELGFTKRGARRAIAEAIQWMTCEGDLVPELAGEWWDGWIPDSYLIDRLEDVDGERGISIHLAEAGVTYPVSDAKVGAYGGWWLNLDGYFATTSLTVWDCRTKGVRCAWWSLGTHNDWPPMKWPVFERVLAVRDEPVRRAWDWTLNEGAA